ncbi:hypothetical protein D9M68_562500 [compost metagenome]
MMSLPAPPRMMLPAPKLVTPAPRNSCSPAIRAMPSAVSELPSGPFSAISAASALSPRRKSLNCDPDKPSTKAKRSKMPKLEDGSGGSKKSSMIMSASTPTLSNL